MKIIKWIISLGLAGIIGSAAAAAELTFESDTKVKKPSQVSFQNMKAGDSVSFSSDEPLLAITQKGLPILFYCPHSKSERTTILDADMSTALQEELQPALESQTNEIITQLRKAESLIKKKEYQQAQNMVTLLKAKYHNVSSILFMSGTLYYLLNNKTSAIEELQKGLAINPNDESAQRLLAQLKGNS